MERKTYTEKLRDPRWQKKRLEILNRDGWKCMICGDKVGTLHVHHIFYMPGKKEPWDIPDGLLITLCEDCHEDKCELGKCEDCEHYFAAENCCLGVGSESTRLIYYIASTLNYLWMHPEKFGGGTYSNLLDNLNALMRDK